MAVFRRPELEKDNPIAPQMYVGPSEGEEKGSGVIVDRLVRLGRTSPSPKRRW
jgi:hypothetical protein